MFDPQRPVVIERCDTLGGRNERRAALRGRCLNEVDNRLLHWAVVPRGQRIGLCRDTTGSRDQQRRGGVERHEP